MIWTCTTCGKSYLLPEGVAFKHRCLGPRVASVPLDHNELSAPSLHQTGPGSVLTRLLADLGFVYTPECNCRSVAAAMDAGDTQWCRANFDWIVAEMLMEARRRQLFGEDERITMAAFQSTAAWLVDLAIALVEEQRSPSLMERVRLRALRFAAKSRLDRPGKRDHDTLIQGISHA